MTSPTPLDATFGALADGTRRAILARLGAEGDLPVSTLAEPFDMSLPAVMKHLGVLERAGLIGRTKVGRTVHCHMVPDSMKAAMDWLTRYEAFWTQQLDALAAFVEQPDELPGYSSADIEPAADRNDIDEKE